jgi:glutaminyl-tRNA synthetase
VYIERDDFMEDPPRRFYRLAPGREVRLRYACLITCTDVVKDDQGEIVEVHCTYDPESRGGNAPDGRRVQGTIHWVSAAHAIPVEIRLYDNLFTESDPGGSDTDFLDLINRDSLETVTAIGEPALGTAEAGDRFQFERLGYFCADTDSRPGAPVFNRTTTLRDTWARISQRDG